MRSLIGFSVRGKTYYFLNTLSNKQLELLKQFVNNYKKINPAVIEGNDDDIIEQFILDANKLLKLHLYLLNIEEILIIK